MATSAAPAAVEALLSITRAATGLADALIVDGPPGPDLSGSRRIYIGWSPGAEQAVEISQDFASAGARTRDEELTIVCYAEVRLGDKDMALARSRVFELVAGVEVALRATNEEPEAPTLRGTVLWAHLTTGSLIQDKSSGSLAGLAFTVACRARI